MTDRHAYGNRAAHHAAELTERAESVLDASTGTPVPWAPIGSTLVILLGAWLWCSFPLLSLPSSALGWNTSLRDEGIAAVNEVVTGMAAVVAAVCAKAPR